MRKDSLFPCALGSEAFADTLVYRQEKLVLKIDVSTTEKGRKTVTAMSLTKITPHSDPRQQHVRRPLLPCILIQKATAMGVIFVLIIISLIVALGFLAAFLWAVRSGQYEDDYTPSMRILLDDNKPEEG